MDTSSVPDPADPSAPLVPCASSARPAPVPGAPAAEAPTLASLLATGAGEALTLVAAPAGTDVPVRGVGLFDAGETFAARDQVLVAVGVDDSSDAAPAVLRSAARAGAAAVVMRRGANGPSRRLAEQADDTATALLTRAPWVEWTELVGMLRAGLAHGGGPAGGEPPTDVPLGDLPALALAFSRLVGGAITVEDPESRVLAFSPTESGADPLRRLTILGQRVPRWRLAELTASGFLRTLWATDDVVHRPAEERFPERLAIAVRAGGEVLGSLWAAADGGPLRPDAREALREAARIAAPHLLHHRQRARDGERHRRRAVRALLDGAADARAAAATLGLAPGTPCAVLAVGTAPGPAASAGEERTGEARWDRALRMAALEAAAHPQGCHALRTDDRLEVLVPLPEGPDEARSKDGREDAAEGGTGPGAPADRARRLALRLARAVRSAGARPLVAVGPVRPEPARAAESRESAGLVLRVLRERHAAPSPEEPPDGGRAHTPGRPAPPDVADESDVRTALDALRAVRAVAELAPGVDGPVRRLLAHDAEQRTELAPTLAVYLARFGDVPAAARHLGVHPNTLRYRLRRLRTHFGLDLADPDVRLLAELGLRAADLLPLP